MILDTDVLGRIVSPRCPQRLRQELTRCRGALYTTAVNWAEIRYGLARHPDGRLLHHRYDQLVFPAIEILDFDAGCAELYGGLRAELEAKGESLAEADLMIAAIALRHKLPLVTGNTRHFGRVPGVVLHDWLSPR